MPSIHKIYQEIKQNGLVILLINVKETPATVRKAVKKRGYSLAILLDTNAAVARDYGVWGTPAVYLIDSQGYVVAGGVGPRPWESPAGIRVLKSLGREVN